MCVILIAAWRVTTGGCSKNRITRTFHKQSKAGTNHAEDCLVLLHVTLLVFKTAQNHGVYE